jgi:hypothetical protein
MNNTPFQTLTKLLDPREDLLNGKLTITPVTFPTLTDLQQAVIRDFWEALWHNYLLGKTLCTTVWMDKFEDDQLFNSLIKTLQNSGWIISTVSGNYGQIALNTDKLLEYVSKEELSSVIREHKFSQYLLTYTLSGVNDRVKVNNTYRKTGLIRNGFMKAGNNIFQYDTKTLQNYVKQIAEYEISHLAPSNKDIPYQDMVDLCLLYCSMPNADYSLGVNTSDSRGRSIYSCTGKVFNPIGYKSARSLLVCPEKPLTDSGLKAVYRAIAVLLKANVSTIEEREAFGKNAFINRILPTYTCGKELYEKIWLERLYKNLENPIRWNVPIELDSVASMVQIIGVLVNSHSFMEQTNLTYSGKLHDIWSIEGLNRKQVKACLQPTLYGSGATVEKLWRNGDISFTTEQVSIMLKALYSLLFKAGLDFRNFIMENVKPYSEMKVRIWNDTFSIRCNKFRWDKGEKRVYPILTERNKVSVITREVFLTPDLEQFRRYFITLLIHNLDSQIADYICQHMDWVLPNHDAFIVHPNDVEQCSSIYTKKLYKLYRNRKKILSDYFQSIGIDKTFPEVDNGQIGGFCFTCLK